LLNRDRFFKKNDDSAQRAVNFTPALTYPAPLNDAAPRPAINPAARPETPQTPERAKSPQTTSSRLIVGPDIKLKGVEITDCDTLVVEGTVEASMDSRVVKIAEHGVFKGTVSIDIAEIHGRFEGELTARDQLIIHSTGRVSGKIRYGKIQIEEGGEIDGDIAKTDKTDKTDKTETRLLRASQPALKAAGAAD